MQLGIEMDQKQMQKISLTPELRQSIKILQFSTTELLEFIQKLAMENPFLEISEFSNLEFISSDYKKPSFRGSVGDIDFDPILHYPDTKITLESHLMDQVNTSQHIPLIQKRLLKYLINHLNDSGFLEIDSAVVANRFAVSLEEVEKAIKTLQTLDPIGVGARDLANCLFIQLKSMSNSPNLAQEIVQYHLIDLSENRYPKIAKMYNVSVNEVQKAADFIKTLNPHPCSQFLNEMTSYITPDVIIKSVKDDYVIIVNDSILSTFSINQFYKQKLKDPKVGEAEEYLKKKYNEINALMNGISQRKLTLYKVVKTMIEMQKDFLQKGMSGLKPMTLKDVSEQLGFHESTISRATSNKYIQTKHGLNKLRDFFTTGLVGANNIETESSYTVKEKIKSFIDNECKQKPLSDQALVRLLEQKGSLVSRRTVAKYREEVGIPNSSKRKRF